MIKSLEKYLTDGWRLFPVGIEKKKPLIKNNLEEASDDPQQIAKWATKFPGCNWGVSLAASGLFAIDVDWKHGGMALWQSIIDKENDGRWPVTKTALTSTDGLHFIFKADNDTKYRGKISKGIDVKHNGYVLISPSLGSNGLPYRWVSECESEPQEAPYWIVKLVEKRFIASNSEALRVNASDKFLLRCVEILKKEELDYEEWTHAGMAIHSALPGPDGLELFLNLTQGESYKEGDLDLARGKWEGFSTTGGITPRTLNHIIKEKGLEPPNPTLEDDIKVFKGLQRKEYEQKRAESSGFEKVNGKYLCYDESAIIEYFHRRGFVFCKSDLKNPFVEVSGGAKGVLNIRGTNVQGLANYMAPFFFVGQKETAKEIKEIYQPAHEIWISSADREEIEGVVFEPVDEERTPDGFLNVFTGIPIEHRASEVGSTPEHILDLIYVSLCNCSDEKFNWFLDWLAHIIQRPNQKATTVPVFIGKQGAGKGLMADHVMRSILGDLYVDVTTSEELTGRFNHHLSAKLLTHIDEATWRGNKSEDSKLKSIIGSPTLSVEQKFGLRYTVSNYSRYMISSNNREAVALEMGNRRYCVIETNDSLANNLGYFGPIADAIKYTDEVPKFYNFLKLRDISHFNPYQILASNTAGAESKIATEGVVAQFWADVLFEEAFPCMHKGNMYRAQVFEHFTRYTTKLRAYQRGISQLDFWTRTNLLIKSIFAASDRRKPDPVTGARVRVIRVDLSRARKEFCESLVIDLKEELAPPLADYELKPVGSIFE